MLTFLTISEFSSEESPAATITLVRPHARLKGDTPQNREAEGTLVESPVRIALGKRKRWTVQGKIVRGLGRQIRAQGRRLRAIATRYSDLCGMNVSAIGKHAREARSEVLVGTWTSTNNRCSTMGGLHHGVNHG
jgi:hypothetical protein